MNKLFDTYGEYVPGFFLIRLNKDLFEGIGWQDFDEEERATLAHEYVHYLQDITTTRGINNFIYVSKILQLNFASAYEKDIIKLPINIEQAANKEAYIESELQSFYQGDSEHKKIHHINKIVREEEEIVNSLLKKEESMYSINIYYDDKDMPYMVGNTAIAESMAYLIEKSAFNGMNRDREFPYNVCELICEKYCSWMIKKTNVLVAACELSLMHYHSGDMFWHIVQELADKKLVFNTVDEFEKHFLKRTYFLYENLKDDFKEVQDCLDFLYPTNVPKLKEINDRLAQIVFKGYDYRDKKKLFIAKILEGSSALQMLSTWMNYFEIPIIMDKNNCIYAGSDLAIMVGPLAMYNFFMRRSGNDCGLINLCCAQRVFTFDAEICNSKPWCQSQKDQLCLFGMYWHLYSLDGKKVERE